MLGLGLWVVVGSAWFNLNKKAHFSLVVYMAFALMQIYSFVAGQEQGW